MNQDEKKADRLLQATCQVLNSASLRVNQYKQVVQKKIDLGAIQKKIEQLHSELGKQVDKVYEQGKTDLLADREASQLLEKLVSLKQAATLLEEEIELIRTENLPKSKQQEDAMNKKPLPMSPETKKTEKI